MRFLFLALAALVISVVLALMANKDPGYVLISRGDWALETTLTFTLAAIAVSFVVLYFLLRTAVNSWHMPRRIHSWREHRRAARARRASQRGLIELAEGHWSRAERDLVKYAEDSDTPLLNYLGAARAAQKQDASQRRDHYLSMAHHSMPEAELAVGLTQAEVQISNRQLEQALATLQHLRTLAPKHAHVLYLLKRLYEQLDSWGDLAELLPDLRRYKIVSGPELEALERKTYARLLGIAARTGRIQRLREAWAELPKDAQRMPELVGFYAEQLDKSGEGTEAEQVIREQVKREWNPQLVYLYGLIRSNDSERQLTTAEGWLKKHERDPVLLLTAGRLSLHNRLWGKARSYLEASVGVDPRPETYRELGVLLDQLNEHELAAGYFRKGLEASVGDGACTAFQVEHQPQEALPAAPPPEKESTAG